MDIRYSPTFAKKFKKLPKSVKSKAVKQEKIFRKEPHDPKLKTHKLTGSLRGLWSFSINYQYRIIFEFKNKDTVYFHTVGTHGVYKK